MALQYWICPSCDTAVHEENLDCRCGYRTTKDEIEKSKIPLQEVVKRVDERKKSKEKEKHEKEERLPNTESSSKSCTCPHCEESISADLIVCPFCAESIDDKGAVTVHPSTPSGSVTESVRNTEGINPIKPASQVDEKLKIKMSRLNGLLADGFITKKEYDDKKQLLLNEYLDV